MGRTDEMQIRAYQHQDRSGFARLVGAVLTEFGFTVDPVLEADLDDPLRDYGAVWVAQHGGEIIGSVAIRLLEGGEVAELKRMYVGAAYRGQGLGRALLRHATEWAENQRCRSIVLDTSTAMTAAMRLYETAGFVQTGTRTEAGEHDSRCEILYRLELSTPHSAGGD